MKTVGIRDLKNRLSEYLRQVRAGESVLVTDRGEVIAEVSAPGHRIADANIPAGLQALARRGLATLGSSGEGGLYKRVPRTNRGQVSAAQLLDEERGSR